LDIDKAIKILKNWVNNDREMRNATINNNTSDFDEFCENRNIAIETVLDKLEEYRSILLK